MNDIIKDSLILFAITLIAGGLLGATFSITEQPIIDQNAIQNNIALSNVIADAEFTEIEIVNPESHETLAAVNEAVKGDEIVGYAFKVITSEGYGGDVELVVGMDIKGKITGIDIIKHSETAGLGANADEDEFKNQFAGQNIQPLVVDKNESGDGVIQAISAATITSKAVTNAVNDAIEYYNNEITKEGI